MQSFVILTASACRASPHFARLTLLLILSAAKLGCRAYRLLSEHAGSPNKSRGSRYFALSCSVTVTSCGNLFLYSVLSKKTGNVPPPPTPGFMISLAGDSIPQEPPWCSFSFPQRRGCHTSGVPVVVWIGSDFDSNLNTKNKNTPLCAFCPSGGASSPRSRAHAELLAPCPRRLWRGRRRAQKSPRGGRSALEGRRGRFWIEALGFLRSTAKPWTQVILSNWVGSTCFKLRVFCRPKFGCRCPTAPSQRAEQLEFPVRHHTRLSGKQNLSESDPSFASSGRSFSNSRMCLMKTIQRFHVAMRFASECAVLERHRPRSSPSCNNQSKCEHCDQRFPNCVLSQLGRTIEPILNQR